MARSAVRSAVARAGRNPALAALAWALDGIGPGRPDVLAVLTYHRVNRAADAPWLHPGLISATPEAFAEQMAFLAANHHVVSLDEVMASRHRQQPLRPRSVLVTFDDAYVDFDEHAWPVLRGLGLPATLFVPTAYPDDPERRFWWDRLHHCFAATAERNPIQTAAGLLTINTDGDRMRSWARLRSHLKQLPHDGLEAEVDRVATLLDPPPAPPGPVLGWERLRHLAGEGLTLAAHTRTHPLLTQVPRHRILDEVLGSIRDLQRETGRAPCAFAYPGGSYDREVVEAVEEAGIELAFTTSPGVNDVKRGNWLRLRRVNVGQTATPSILRLRLLPALARMDRSGG